jgi:hypothetical protein
MEQNYTHQFSELSNAICNGYHHQFNLCSDGSLNCRSNQVKHYEIEELNITTITCFVNKATIYLIDTLDGLYHGVLVDYWENYSS